MKARKAINGGGEELILLAVPTLHKLIRKSRGTLKTLGFRRAIVALASELSGSRLKARRDCGASKQHLRFMLRRTPDAWRIDPEQSTVFIYEAEDTACLTKEKVFDYYLLAKTARLKFGWRVELILIDRYGRSSTEDPEKLYYETVLGPMFGAWKESDISWGGIRGKGMGL